MQAQHIRNMLVAAMVADAFGVPVEGQRRDTYQVTTMTNGGVWHQPVGSWSDDTAMSLALLDHLTVGGTYADLMERFAAYMFKGAYTPTGNVFGMGQTCRVAIQRYVHDQVEPTKAGSDDELSNGNGALMRLAPLAIVLADEPSLTKRLQLTHDYTCLTHRHPRAILASDIYLELLHALLNGATWSQALKSTATILPEALQKQSLILNEWPAFKRLWQPGFGQLSRTAIRSTAYVVDTLEAAVWVNLNSTELSAAIQLAANLGEDADTIATISASLFTAVHPTAMVPLAWAQALNHGEIADELIRPFVARVTMT